MAQSLVFLGAPGSGKGTQSKLLSEEHGFKHLSTGDLLREEIQKKSPLGQRVDDIMKQGKLVDDATVIDLLADRFQGKNQKYIIDGFPRNEDQAKLLDERLFKGKGYAAVFFNMETEELVDRLSGRITCRQCGAVYNLKTMPPAKTGVCDKCSSQDLYQRNDDKAEVVSERLKIYEENIRPVLRYYQNKGLLTIIDAGQETSTLR